MCQRLCKFRKWFPGSSDVSANFLCDNAKYFLGIDREMDDNNKKCRALECFHAAREKHLLLLDGVKGEMAQAIGFILKTGNLKRQQENEEIKEIWDDLTDGRESWVLHGDEMGTGR